MYFLGDIAAIPTMLRINPGPVVDGAPVRSFSLLDRAGFIEAFASTLREPNPVVPSGSDWQKRQVTVPSMFQDCSLEQVESGIQFINVTIREDSKVAEITRMAHLSDLGRFRDSQREEMPLIGPGWHKGVAERVFQILAEARARVHGSAGSPSDSDLAVLRLLERIVREMVEGLAHGEYRKVIDRCVPSFLTAEELEELVKEYGRTLIVPPPDAYRDLDAVRIDNTPCEAWSVWAPLWTLESGRADLTLQLTIEIEGEEARVKLDGLHVL